LQRLLFDTRFKAYNAPRSGADLGGAWKGGGGDNFLGREKFFSPLSCLSFLGGEQWRVKKMFHFSKDSIFSAWLLLYDFVFQQNKGVSLTADFLFP